MKKIIAMILSLAMILAIAVTMGVSVAADPEGTPINTPADFAAMAADGKYYLNADITIDTPYANEFCGTFDGNGKTVTTTSAMFMTVKDATISNFTVKGDIVTDIIGYEVGSEDFAAAVALVVDGVTSFKDITSRLNFTSTSANTRYGSIAATAIEGAEITIENCFNYGTIDVAKYAGGIFGWSAQKGFITIKNCHNFGDITAGGYCSGILDRFSAKSGGTRIVIKNCTNKGNITSTTSYAAGIYTYGETFVDITDCINFGNVTAVKGSTGGIIGNMAEPGSSGTHFIERNINYGNVTNTEGNTGGIVGYCWAGTSAQGYFACNINYGTISSGTYSSQIVGYTNSINTEIYGNIGAGANAGTDENKSVIVGCSSADTLQYIMSHNYYIENDGTKMYSYANDDKHAANRHPLSEMPEGNVIFVSADKLHGGEVAGLLNAELKTSEYLAADAPDLFVTKDGKIALKCAHGYYSEYSAAGTPPTCGADGTGATYTCLICGEAVSGEVIPATGDHDFSIEDAAEVPPTCTEAGKYAVKKCSVCGATSGGEEIDALGHNFKDGVCKDCGEADPSVTTQAQEPVTEPGNNGGDETEPANSGCGSMIAGSAVVIALLGTALVIKKRD